MDSKLTRAREDARLVLSEVVDQLGLSRDVLVSCERRYEEAGIGMWMATRLAKLYDVSTEWLMDYKDESGLDKTRLNEESKECRMEIDGVISGLLTLRERGANVVESLNGLIVVRCLEHMLRANDRDCLRQMGWVHATVKDVSYWVAAGKKS